MSDIVVIYPGESLSLDPSSSAFAHGFGLFETMSYSNGQLYFWKNHWSRMSESAKQFKLSMPPADVVLAAIEELITSSKSAQAIVKLSLVKNGKKTRLFIYERPSLPKADSRALLMDRSCPINEHSILTGHKTHNYMECMHLLSSAHGRGCYDMLRVNLAGNLAETTTANLFFALGGQLHTPSVDAGILPGVTRSALLHSSILDIQVGHYQPSSLLEADAVFLTNAITGLVPIDQISGFSGGQTVDFRTKNFDLTPIASEFERIRASQAVKLL